MTGADERGAPRRRWGLLALRIVLILVAAAIVLVFLFTWLFPRVERFLENPTVGHNDAAVVDTTGGG